MRFDDPITLLIYLLACEAAATFEHLFQVGDVLQKLEDAYL